MIFSLLLDNLMPALTEYLQIEVLIYYYYRRLKTKLNTGVVLASKFVRDTQR